MIDKNRPIALQITKRIREKTPLIQVMVGPRQVGKTTILQNLLKDKGILETADFPTPLPSTVIGEWWKKALSDPNRILAIDEVQKITDWSDSIKYHWDKSIREKNNLKLILTGSSALLVEKGLKETLAGRFELIKIPHWSYEEVNNIFGLELAKYIEFGGYPGAIRFLDDIPRWAAYIRDSIVEPAIGRDLLQLHPVENPALLRQLFGLAVSLPAQITSLEKLLGQLQQKGSKPTIQNYLGLLSQSFLVTGIERFSPSMFRTKKSMPKLIIHDNALLRAFERPIVGELDSKKKGRYLENLVGARLLESGFQTYYWKERQYEVDYVVIGPQGEKWAIEVKYGNASDEDLVGLRYFIKENPTFEPILASTVQQEFTGIRFMSVKDILAF